jgi:hypothetical protein
MTACITNARHSRGWVAGHAHGWGGQDSTSTRRGASTLCRVLLMQAVISCERRQYASNSQAGMMLSAHRSVVRENRRNLYCVGKRFSTGRPS